MIDIFFPFFIWPQIIINKKSPFRARISSFISLCLHLHEVDWSDSNNIVVASRHKTCMHTFASRFFIKHLLFYTFTKVINAPLLEIYMWDFISNVRRCAAQVRLELLERYVWFIEWNRGRSRPHRWFLNKKLVKHQVNNQIAPIKPLQCINTHWIS